MLPMTRHISIAFGLLALAFACVACGPKEEQPANNTPATTPPATTAAGFASIQPILNENCVKCHGNVGPKGGIDLTTYAGMMKGGEDGPIVLAGNPDGSKIVMALKGAGGVKPMPMMAKPLTADKIDAIANWIRDGAKEK